MSIRGRNRVNLRVKLRFTVKVSVKFRNRFSFEVKFTVMAGLWIEFRILNFKVRI